MSLRSRWTIDPGRRPVGLSTYLQGGCRDPAMQCARCLAHPQPPSRTCRLSPASPCGTLARTPYARRFHPCPPRVPDSCCRPRPSGSGKILGIQGPLSPIGSVRREAPRLDPPARAPALRLPASHAVHTSAPPGRVASRGSCFWASAPPERPASLLDWPVGAMPRPRRHTSHHSRETVHRDESGLVPELNSIAVDDAGPTPVAGPLTARFLMRPLEHPSPGKRLVREPTAGVCPVTPGADDGIPTPLRSGYASSGGAGRLAGASGPARSSPCCGLPHEPVARSRISVLEHCLLEITSFGARRFTPTSLLEALQNTNGHGPRGLKRGSLRIELGETGSGQRVKENVGAGCQ